MSYTEDERIKKELDDEVKEKQEYWKNKEKKKKQCNSNDVDDFEMDAYSGIDGDQH